MLHSQNKQQSGFGHAAQLDNPDLPLKSLLEAQALTASLVSAAQAEYDKWDESDVDTYAGGGICHLIADEMVRVLDCGGIDASSVSSSHEQHVYVACKLAGGVYSLDIRNSIYERGAAFTWSKIAGVRFDASCLDWYRVDPDPKGYAAYLD